MGINIGDGNTFQGNIVIGEKAQIIAKNFNQEFNSIEKILDLLKYDLITHYNKEDKELILKTFDEFKGEVLKPEKSRNSSILKDTLRFLNTAFSFIGNSSSIAGLILTISKVIN